MPETPTVPSRYIYVRPRGVGPAARQHAADAERGRPARPARPERRAVAGRGGADLPAAVAPAQPLRAAPPRSCTARRRRSSATTATKVPFIIGLAGSVAVGKSTTARILQALLSRWPSHPSVDLVTTDGFLFPNAVLDSARHHEAARAFPRATTAPGWCASSPTSSRACRRCSPRSTRTSATTSCPARRRPCASPTSSSSRV